MLKQFLILYLIFINLFALSQNAEIDTLFAKLKKIKADTSRALVYNSLAFSFKNIDSQKALSYADSAIECSMKTNFLRGYFNGFIIKGIIYKNEGKFDKSVEIYLKALKYAENNNDKVRMSNCLNNIANIYHLQHKYQDAIRYYNQSLNIENALRSKAEVSLRYYNIGVSYESLKLLDSAYFYYNQSLILEKELQNTEGIYFALYGLGGIEIARGNNQLALQNLTEALSIAEKTNDIQGKTICSIELGKIYVKLNQLNASREILEKAILYSESTKNNNNKRDALTTLADVYHLMGNDSKSREILTQFISLNDSMYNQKTSEIFAELQTKYETDKKEKEIALLNKDNEIQTVKLKQQNYIIYSFILGLVLVLIFVYFIIKAYNAKKKANVLLALQKDEIQSQAEELRVINEELEKLSIVASETDNSVVIANGDGEIEWVNEGFTRLFGFTKEEFISEFGSNLKKVSNNKDIESVIKACINEHKTVVYTAENTSKAGKKFWTQTTLTPIIKDNKLFKLVAIDSNITKLKQAEEEIFIKSELLEKTNKELETKNIQITDSIRYAKQIQDAMLPGLSPKLKASSSKYQNLDFETFILFRPKDIVSGDFYWFSQTYDFMFVAVVDCTGHGVPGAFMSMIGNTLLNEIVNQKKIYDLEVVLQKLHEGVMFSLSQKGKEFASEDGMEISICKISETKIEVAATNQNVIIINGEEIIEVEGGIFSIGSDFPGTETKFTSSTFDLRLPTQVYLFSDGYQDQFGGQNDCKRKFSYDILKSIIFENRNKDLYEQLLAIESNFDNWKENTKQTDDVTVIGIKIIS